MALTDIPIFSMLRTRMEWSQERQRVLAENVANADTPNYRARDLVQPKFNPPGTITAAPAAKVHLSRTEDGHIPALSQSGSPFRAEGGRSYAVSPTGNAVDLEEEMMKVASNQMDYQAATALYTRSLALIKTAIGKR